MEKRSLYTSRELAGHKVQLAETRQSSLRLAEEMPDWVLGLQACVKFEKSFFKKIVVDIFYVKPLVTFIPSEKEPAHSFY